MSDYEDRTLTLSKHEIVVDRVNEITVVIEGGMCVDVRGLPEEWDYAIEDYDGEKNGDYLACYPNNLPRLIDELDMKEDTDERI